MQVSVITAVGPRSGHQRYLEQAYESLRVSTLEEWEWCVQIDSNPEFHSSRDIRLLEGWSEKDPRIKIGYNATHSGISVTRNLALIRAAGEFAMALDSDDTLMSDTLRRWAWILDSDESLAYVFGTPQVKDQGRPKEAPKPDVSPLDEGRLESGVVSDAWLKDKKMPLHPEAVMWRRNLALRFGGYSALPNGGDEALALALADAFPVFHDSEPSWSRRLHPESTSAWKDGAEVRQVDGTKAMMDLHRIGRL